MKSMISILIFALIPVVGSAAGNIIVNNQPIYDIPPDTTNVLISDLTLPEKLTSIKILNLGDAQQWDISNLSVFEDGASPGWNGDETEIIKKISSPFWDTEISGSSSKLRIFVTVDIASTVASEKTIKPQITINSDETIIGFKRTISASASQPTVPVAPLIKSGEAISSSVIRWNFLDLSNNEFGFKIKDASLRTVAEVAQSDISYINETGLEPNTCYSGRRVFAFNDRGESSASANFAEICTLSAPTPTPTPVVEEGTGEYIGGPLSPQEELKEKIAEAQQKVIGLLNQLIQLLQEQIKKAQASLFNSFEIFTNWLESHF